MTADARLLGRATYEGFRDAWSTTGGDSYVDKMNAMPEYVASTTLALADLAWNVTLLGEDVPSEVGKLKDQSGGDLVKLGTVRLDHTLLGHGLHDELHLWTFPAIAGVSDRLLDGLDVTSYD